MPSETFEQLLDRAASLFGIAPGYWDIWGRYHNVPAAARQDILQAMGIAAGDATLLAQSLSDLVRREWQRLLPPVFVTLESESVEFTVNVAAESLGEHLQVTLLRESGDCSEHSFLLADLPQAASAARRASARAPACPFASGS